MRKAHDNLDGGEEKMKYKPCSKCDSISYLGMNKSYVCTNKECYYEGNIIERIKTLVKERCKCVLKCKNYEKRLDRIALNVTPKRISEHPFYIKIKSLPVQEVEVLCK